MYKLDIEEILITKPDQVEHEKQDLDYEKI